MAINPIVARLKFLFDDQYNMAWMSTDFLIGKQMGSRISRLFNGFISYVFFVLTFYIPVPEESFYSMRCRPPQAYYLFLTHFCGGVVKLAITETERLFLMHYLALGYPDWRKNEIKSNQHVKIRNYIIKNTTHGMKYLHILSYTSYTSQSYQKRLQLMWLTGCNLVSTPEQLVCGFCLVDQLLAPRGHINVFSVYTWPYVHT